MVVQFEDPPAPTAASGNSGTSGDWHASVRGPMNSSSNENNYHGEEIKKKRTNRGSLDGTRRFRKVVTFRKSLVQTRTIASRSRGRNSLLPWFSNKAQEHTQEVLEEQERQRQDKAAKKQQKKDEKIRKKEEKEQQKKDKKEAKKRQKQAKKMQNNEIVPSGEIQIFEEDDDNMDMDMDMSLSLGAAMGNSSKNIQNNDNTSFVDYSRRRSSVSTAILDTMRMFTNNARKNRRTRRFPKNEPRSNKNSMVQEKENNIEQNYDWSAHLRTAQADAETKHSDHNKSPQALLPRQISEQGLIDEEENEFERAMQTLPKSNPTNRYLHQKTQNETKKLNDSILDISGESFADPDAPDTSSSNHPTKFLATTSKPRGKKSVLRLFSASTTASPTSSMEAKKKKKNKSSPTRKPSPIGSPGHPHASNGSVNGPLANLVALELNKSS